MRFWPFRDYDDVARDDVYLHARRKKPCTVSVLLDQIIGAFLICCHECYRFLQIFV